MPPWSTSTPSTNSSAWHRVPRDSICCASPSIASARSTIISSKPFSTGSTHYEEQAKQAAEEAHAAVPHGRRHENLQAAGQVLALFVDPSIAGDTPFCTSSETSVLPARPRTVPAVSNYMRQISFDKTGFQWAYYTRLSLTFKRNLRHLFSDIDFGGRVEEAPLLEAVRFLQGLLRQGKSPRQAPSAAFPVDGHSPRVCSAIYLPKRPARRSDWKWIAMNFCSIACCATHWKRAMCSSSDSNEFRRFEDDLISDARWQDKETHPAGDRRAPPAHADPGNFAGVPRSSWKPSTRLSINASPTARTNISRSADTKNEAPLDADLSQRGRERQPPLL